MLSKAFPYKSRLVVKVQDMFGDYFVCLILSKWFVVDGVFKVSCWFRFMYLGGDNRESCGIYMYFFCGACLFVYLLGSL